jgi:hypothetical protein
MQNLETLQETINRTKKPNVRSIFLNLSNSIVNIESIKQFLNDDKNQVTQRILNHLIDIVENSNSSIYQSDNHWLLTKKESLLVTHFEDQLSKLSSETIKLIKHKKNSIINGPEDYDD